MPKSSLLGGGGQLTVLPKSFPVLACHWLTRIPVDIVCGWVGVHVWVGVQWVCTCGWVRCVGVGRFEEDRVNCCRVNRLHACRQMVGSHTKTTRACRANLDLRKRRPALGQVGIG